MVSSGLRARKKARTREVLISSAAQQFAARGFDNVTIEDIAQACEVSPRTFFRYFASKEDVLFPDGDDQCSRLVQAIAAQPGHLSAARAIQAAVLKLADDFEHRRAELRQRRHIMRSAPSLQVRMAERYNHWESAIIEELRNSPRAQGMTDLDIRLLVAACLSAFRVSTDIWCDDDSADNLSALLTASLDRICTGLDAS